MKKVECTGPRHEPEGCEWECPYGYSRHDDETWEDCCQDCRGEVDEWADLMFRMRYEEGRDED